MTGTILYLHGHNDSPSKAPGDAILRHVFGFRVEAPNLGNFLLPEKFDQNVATVSRWMAGSVLTIGNATGAWLALCAAGERSDFPHLLLLSPFLGRSLKVDPGSRFGQSGKWLALRAALGLEGPLRCSPFGIDRITIIAPRQDSDFHTTEDLARLTALGYCIMRVPGDGALTHPMARTVIAKALWQYNRKLPSVLKPMAKARPRETVLAASHKKRFRSFSG